MFRQAIVFRQAIALLVLSALAACGQPDTTTQSTNTEPGKSSDTTTAAATPAADVLCENHTEERMALFGDLHVHTSFSFDAAANTTGATPIDANRYARGEAIPFFPVDENGTPIGTAQIDRPLDFLAVTDHGEFLGERAICRTPGSPNYESQFCKQSRASERQGMLMLGTVITTETPERLQAVCGEDLSLCPEYAKSPWQQIQDAANTSNDPCAFTSFIGYEYTGTPGTSNYHRNVIFANDQVPELPVSYIDAPIDSKLWSVLDLVCKDDCNYLTIPHNSNLANGRMAPYMQLPPNLTNRQTYANTRLRREPIMEIFQHKGGSECINGLTSVLGQPDELCDVEAVRRMGEEKTYVGRRGTGANLETFDVSQVTKECAPGEIGNSGMLGAGCVDATDFQRSGLVVGLKEAAEIGVNPVKLGIIAATDTHTATPGNVAEDDWGGAVTGESTPSERLQPGLLTSGIDGNPGGLAGVWAKQNTRTAIFDAMLNREVFGTSGPRITPRFFAGDELPEDLCSREDMVAASYAAGVPMGGDLPAASKAPRFLAWAAKDPAGLDLAELHLVKGWVEQDGTMRTQVTKISTPDQPTASLCTVTTDADFDPKQPAYYYLRVTQPPTARWHTYDCNAIAEADRPEVCNSDAYPDQVVEMAWSSPIWYQPAP